MVRWLLALVVIATGVVWSLAAEPAPDVSANGITAVATPVDKPTTKPRPTTRLTPPPLKYPEGEQLAPDRNDDENVPLLCPGGSGWSRNGGTITVTIVENGPASVTVTVNAAQGGGSQTQGLGSGQTSATFTFPSTSGVKNIAVRSNGPLLPERCMLAV